MIEHDGIRYARITSDILGPFSNFDDIPPEILHRKASIGTAVHEAIHRHSQGLPSILGPAERPYYESFLKWKAATKASLVSHAEHRFYCPKKRITGQIDGLMRFSGGSEVLLVDYKTSSGESRIVWPMQGHLYYYLLGEAGLQVSERILFIKLDQHGDLPRVFQYKIDPATMQKCMEAVDTFWKSH